MTARYKIDPGQGRLTVRAFATGMLASLGHSPTFAAREFSGQMRLTGPEADGLAVDLTVQAGSLALLDAVKPADRAEIEGRMHRDVLESADFPEIRFQTVESAVEPVGGGHYRVFLGGRLTLRGVIRPHGIDAELLVQPDGLRIRGGCPLRMSAFGIRPVKALAGAIQLKDELATSFDLVAVPEGL